MKARSHNNAAGANVRRTRRRRPDRLSGNRSDHSLLDPRYALIFLTGAVILSVEVLASRIMTPYFGVSLYIWAAILSTTLAFLALGYYWGGKITHRLSRGAVAYYFLGAPVLSAAALVTACLAYPILFPLFLEFDLVVGSFLSSTLLLAVPLISLSAMNPMLVALLDKNKGDSGAGQVFFISTTGSVTGVLFTAFAVIPYIANYRALLLLSLFLSVVAIGVSLSSRELSASHKKRLAVMACAASLLSVALIAGQQRYLQIISANRNSPVTFEVKAEYTSLFGNIKVVEIRPKYPTEPPILAYLQDGLVQNRTLLDGSSISMYTYVLEDLALSSVPKARSALVLGLGGGIVPMTLRREGLDVTVVEINSDSLAAAKRFFRFDPTLVDLHWRDARTFVRRCPADYDIVVVDLFQGDSTPDYLLTKEFFEDLSACLHARGALVMNAFFDTVDGQSNDRLLATVSSAFDNTYVYRSGFGNGFIVGSREPRLITQTRDPSRIPAVVRQIVTKTIASGTMVESSIRSDHAPITDLHNVASIVFAGAQMRLRRALARQFPAHVMVN